MKQLERWRTLSSKYSIFIVLAGMFFISILISPNFLSLRNFSNISRQISIITILAFGQTLIIIAGMIDLSVGSVMALSGLLSVASYKATGSLAVAIGVGVAVGTLCNLISALMVTKFRIPPFIATLAMLTSARGAALLFTNGQNIYQIGNYTVLGQRVLLGVIPIPVLFMLSIFLLTLYLLNETKWGRYLYAVGGNEEAAKVAGISVEGVKLKAFLVNGVFVGLAGVIFMSRVNAGLPSAGAGFELDTISIAIIGGVSITGGVGSAAGTLVGSFIVGFLNNIMNLTEVPSYLQQVIKGAIIAIAVGYDIESKKRSR